METSNYFNFTANATGYINEIKLVETKKDKMCVIKACLLEGPSDAPEKLYVDLIVRGKQAKTVLWDFRDHWPTGYNANTPGSRWFANLRIGSLSAKPYTSKQGKAKAVLAGRLLAISYLKIDDTVIDVASTADAAA